MGFFYVSNPPGDDRDLLNLPEFSLPPPTQHHWSEKPGETDTDVDRQMAQIGELMEQGLTATTWWLLRSPAESFLCSGVATASATCPDAATRAASPLSRWILMI